MYVRKDLTVKRRADLEINDIECLWLEVTPKKGKSFLIGTLYRNPAERAEWADRFEGFNEHVSSENKDITIMGDFNKDLSFTNFNREWADFTTSLGRRQLVTQPTRVTDTFSTLIDHLYSNNEENISNVHVANLV